MTLCLTSCQSAVAPTGDYIARSTIPKPLWMPDKLVDYLVAMPYDKESDDYIIKLAVQQEQLDALTSPSN